MLAGAVAAVDQGMLRDLGGLDGRTGHGVPHNDGVHITVHGADGVLPCLTLGLGGGGGTAQVDGAGAHALNSGVERQPGPGAGLKEQRGHQHTFHVFDGLTAFYALFIDHGCVHDVAQLLRGKVIAVDNVAALEIEVHVHVPPYV